MQPRRVLITGASGYIGTVIRPALREGVEELRLSDLHEPEGVVAPETYVEADLADFEAVQRAVDGVDAVVHLGAVSNEAPFEKIAGPNLHGVFHVFEACRRAKVQRIVYASSNHASGMNGVGVALDGSERARPDGLYGASKAYGEALGSMFVERFGLSIVCLRIGSWRPTPGEKRELSTWLSNADGTRLVQAALTADDVDFAIVYGASANTRRWWPPDDKIGFVPRDDAEVFAAELEGPDYPHQGGPNAAFEHGGWAT
jgi:uronate dehydrogenase